MCIKIKIKVNKKSFEPVTKDGIDALLELE